MNGWPDRTVAGDIVKLRAEAGEYTITRFYGNHALCKASDGREYAFYVGDLEYVCGAEALSE